MSNKGIVLYLDEEARYIAEMTGYSLKVTQDFVNLEDAYFDVIGLNVYGDVSSEDELVSDTVVDDEELVTFVCDRSADITEAMCWDMVDAELEYFKKIGLIEED